MESDSILKKLMLKKLNPKLKEQEIDEIHQNYKESLMKSLQQSQKKNTKDRL